MASGYGGQSIFVIPSEKNVVVTTSRWKVNGHQAGGQQSMSKVLAFLVIKAMQAQD